MAVHQKLSEIGWFYHAPEPPRKSASAGIPLASQIPGLNDLSSIPIDDAPKPLFRDTDTKYIRMAKMGGREDLLRHRDPKPKSTEAKPYPRSDWFYLEDNKLEDESTESSKPWEFRLPEYMVHDEHKPFGDDYDYKNDPEGLIYWKKGRVVPGAPEIKRVSRAQTVQQPVTTAPVRSIHTKPVSRRNQESEKSRYPDVPPMYGAERPAMNKLLAYGYAKEWEPVRDIWYHKIQAVKDAERTAAESDCVQLNKSSKSATRNMTWNDLRSRQTQPVNASRRAVSHTSEVKTPFKLSKFENVGSRVNSHRPLPPIGQ